MKLSELSFGLVIFLLSGAFLLMCMLHDLFTANAVKGDINDILD